MPYKYIFFMFSWVYLCSVCSAYAQESASVATGRALKKNVIHATAGTAGLMGAYNLNYERMLAGGKEGNLKGLWAKAGVGGWGIWSSGGPYQSLMLGALTGQKSSHFEINFGLARMVDQSAYDHAKHMSIYLSEPLPPKSNFINIRAVGSAGYRLQKPGGRFLLRTGIGYPEAVYLGIGAAF